MRGLIAHADAFWDIQLALEAYLSESLEEALLETQNAFARIEGIPFVSPQALADSIGNLKIEVVVEHLDNPYFRVISFDIDAKFSISTGIYLSGKISDRDKFLTSEFFEDHGSNIVSVWLKTRPYGYPEDFIFENPEGPGGIHEVVLNGDDAAKITQKQFARASTSSNVKRPYTKLEELYKWCREPEEHRSSVQHMAPSEPNRLYKTPGM